MTFFQYFGRLHNNKVPALEACFPFHWATPPGYSRGELSCTNVGPMRVKRKLFKVHSFGKVRVRTARRSFFFLLWLNYFRDLFQTIASMRQLVSEILLCPYKAGSSISPFLFRLFHFSFISSHWCRVSVSRSSQSNSSQFSLNTCLSFRFCYLCRKKCSVTQFVPFAPQLTDAWFTEWPCGFKLCFTYFYLGASITQLARMAATN